MQIFETNQYFEISGQNQEAHLVSAIDQERGNEKYVINRANHLIFYIQMDWKTLAIVVLLIKSVMAL
jgi:hypothetical protein